MRNDFAVVLAPFSVGRVGLVIQQVHQAIALERLARSRSVRVYVASVPHEQTPGLWARLQAVFPPERLIRVRDDTPQAFGDAVRPVLDRESKVVLHVGGTRQLRGAAKYRIGFPSRVRVVYTVHSFRNGTWRAIPTSIATTALITGLVDYTIFCSPTAIATFWGSGIVARRGRLGMMVQGFEDEAMDSAPARPGPDDIPLELSRELDREPGFRFLYLTREVGAREGKGQEWLVRGMAPALRSHRDASVIILGRGTPGAHQAIKDMARSESVEEQVHLPGWVERTWIPHVIDRCHAGIVSSKSETFGHAFLEPMTLGKPVIGTRVGVGSWLIMDYFTGIGMEYGDGYALERAARVLLEHRDDAQRMGENARTATRSLFRWGNVVESHLGIYASVWK